MSGARISERRFDVAVIGAGINGTAAAREIAGAGYSLCLIERDDIAAGASARSSRMLHCGLRYFETPRPLRDALRHPLRFLSDLRMARQAMAARAELAAGLPQQLRPVVMNFPVWRGGPVRAWHLRLGMALLGRLHPGGPPLDFRLETGARRDDLPFFPVLRDGGNITGIGTFHEYLFDWPERVAVDNALAAGAAGAVLLIGHAVTGATRAGDGWRLRLTGPGGADHDVHARLVLNMTGSWADDTLAALAPDRELPRTVRGSRGVSIAVRLPQGFEGHALATLNRRGMPFYCMPSHDDVFFIGPTETPFEGDARGTAATGEEVGFLLDEAAYLLPGLGLGPRDVLFTWAGVRPLTHDPARPGGARDRRIHDHAGHGLADVWTMTGGPVMTHPGAGRAMRAIVGARLGPRAPRPARPPAPAADLAISHAPGPAALLAATRRAVLDEHARDLPGILYTRTGLGWRGHLARAEVAAVAAEAARHLGWPPAETEARIDGFLAHQARLFPHHRPPEPGTGAEQARRAS